jgi:hypothetical protein
MSPPDQRSEDEWRAVLSPGLYTIGVFELLGNI